MDLTCIVPPDLILGAGGEKRWVYRSMFKTKTHKPLKPSPNQPFYSFLKSILYFLTLESENRRVATDRNGTLETYSISQISFINSSSNPLIR